MDATTGTSSRQHSKIWDYFHVHPEDASKAACNICNCVKARGGTDNRNYNTTNIIHQLKNQHETEYEEYPRKAAEQKVQMEARLRSRSYD